MCRLHTREQGRIKTVHMFPIKAGGRMLFYASFGGQSKIIPTRGEVEHEKVCLAILYLFVKSHMLRHKRVKNMRLLDDAINNTNQNEEDVKQ